MGKLRKDVLFVLLFGLLAVLLYMLLWKDKDSYLVRDGHARSVIIRQSDSVGKEAIEEFHNQVKKATGVSLPIMDANELESYKLPIGYTRVLIGPGALTDSLGIRGSDLEKEAYRIVKQGQDLAMLGANNMTTLYAVSYFLDKYMGVRYLWPGETGTYTPEKSTIKVPDVDVVQRPALDRRRLRASNSSAEVQSWLGMHMMGSRSEYSFGHAFTTWYGKYGKDHPEYFAQPPKGKVQEIPEYIKLDISNETVDEAIIEEWKAAGKPDNWNVSPNDGSSGYCVSPGCLAMDDRPNQSIDLIWSGKANLTTRYVKFWNRLLDKMRAIQPNVTLTTYAYDSYKEPPEAGGVKLRDGMIIGIVDTFQAYEQWRGWYKTGAKLFLRPNWWISGAVAPNLMLHATGNFFKFAQANGMSGFDFDSIMGHWGTQGINYYLIARLSVRPELSVDDVIAEYTSAFGKAEPAIKDYIQYWEKLSVETAYNVDAGNVVSINPQGRFETVVRQNNLPSSPLSSGWYTLPYLYPNEVLDQAKSILSRAEQLASGHADTISRIALLRDGLRHVELTRDVVRYGYEKTRPQGATLEQFTRMSAELDHFRREIAKRHVIWYDALVAEEARRDIPTVPARTRGWGSEQKR